MGSSQAGKHEIGRSTRRLAVAGCWMSLAAAGCKSDLNQQLLERELRYQEDRIYQLQDELHDSRAHLEGIAGENASLRRQLGVSEGDVRTTPGPARARPAAAAPGLVPPAVTIPDGRPTPAAPGGVLAPPALDGVPPLPGGEPPPVGEPLSLPPPAATGGSRPPPTGLAAVAYEQGAASGVATTLVIAVDRSSCIDRDGDGASDGIEIAIEPRDDQQRLVAAAGDVSITVFDAASGADPVASGAAPLAAWTVPAAEALGHFRRTSRLRGMHFTLPWTAGSPSGDHVRVIVRIVPADGPPLAADAIVGSR